MTSNNVFGFGPGTGLNPVVGDLDVFGNLHVHGTSQLDKDVTCGTNLNVVGNTVLNTLHTTGAAQFDTSINVTGSISGASLNIAGTAAIGSTLQMDNGILPSTIILDANNDFITSDPLYFSPSARGANFAVANVAFGVFPGPNPGPLVFTSTGGALGSFSNPGIWTCPADGYYSFVSNCIVNIVTAMPNVYGSIANYMVYNGAASTLAASNLEFEAIQTNNFRGCCTTFQGVILAGETMQFYGGTAQDAMNLGVASGSYDIRICRLF